MRSTLLGSYMMPDWISLPDFNLFSGAWITSVISFIVVLLIAWFFLKGPGRHLTESCFKAIGEGLHREISKETRTRKGLFFMIAFLVFIIGGGIIGARMYLNAPEYALEADAAEIQTVYDMTADGECQFVMAQPGNTLEETFRMKRTGESFEKEFTIETVRPRGMVGSLFDSDDLYVADEVKVTKKDVFWEHRGINDDDFMPLIRKISSQTCDTPSQGELDASESGSDTSAERTEEVDDVVTSESGKESEKESEELATTDSEKSDEKSGFTKVLEKVKFW